MLQVRTSGGLGQTWIKVVVCGNREGQCSTVPAALREVTTKSSDVGVLASCQPLSTK